MKKILSIIALAVSVMAANAQNTAVSGIYRNMYVAGMMCPDVALFEPKDGHMQVVSETPVAKPDYQFSIDMSEHANLDGKILYLGYNGEFIPFYFKKGDNVEICSEDYSPKYGKKLSRENKAIAKWMEIISPLHHLSHDKRTPYAPADSIAGIMDKAWKASEAYLAKMKTGNKAFDEQARFFLSQQFMYEAYQVFGTGWCASDIKLMPQYIQTTFKADNFNEARLWTSPFAADNILWFSFAKDIICQMKVGQTVLYAVKNVSDPYVRQEYTVYSLENGLVSDALGFIKDNQDLFYTDDAKARVEKVKERYSVKVPGNDWVDMEYEDKDGKMHKLSEFLGKVVVIDVWATWCAPCRAELPHLLNLEKEMEGKDVVFIGYSFDEDKAAWKKWLNEHEMVKVQLWTGAKGPIKDMYDVQAIPQFIIFSKEGKLIDLNGPRPSGPELKALIEKNL